MIQNRLYNIPMDAAHEMTLRDWFAGMVLQAVYTEFWRGHRDGEYDVPDEKWPTAIAMEIYRIADAILDERDKEIRKISEQLEKAVEKHLMEKDDDDV